MNHYTLDSLNNLLERIAVRAEESKRFVITDSERATLRRIANCRPGFRKTIERLGIRSSIKPRSTARGVRRYRTRVLRLEAA
jgi:hypothetical protein